MPAARLRLLALRLLLLPWGLVKGGRRPGSEKSMWSNWFYYVYIVMSSVLYIYILYDYIWLSGIVTVRNNMKYFSQQANTFTATKTHVSLLAATHLKHTEASYCSSHLLASPPISWSPAGWVSDVDWWSRGARKRSSPLYSTLYIYTVYICILHIHIIRENSYKYGNVTKIIQNLWFWTPGCSEHIWNMLKYIFPIISLLK